MPLDKRSRAERRSRLECSPATPGRGKRPREKTVQDKDPFTNKHTIYTQVTGYPYLNIKLL